jgi:hypothetical protein
MRYRAAAITKIARRGLCFGRPLDDIALDDVSSLPIVLKRVREYPLPCLLPDRPILPPVGFMLAASSALPGVSIYRSYFVRSKELLCTEGLFRLSASAGQLSAIKTAFDRAGDCELGDVVVHSSIPTYAPLRCAALPSCAHRVRVYTRRCGVRRARVWAFGFD